MRTGFSPDFRQKMDINSDQFIAYLRGALHHLYEPDQLRRSPLAALLGVAGRVDASSALQKILLQAIQDLRPQDLRPENIRPGEAESQQSQEWRIYEVLFFRYVRGYAREAIANQLGISDRQLSREQRTAIETLALHLWKTFQVDNPQAARAGDPASAPASEPATSAWVEALPTEKPSPWKSILLSVMDLLHPLICENEVTVHYELGENLPDLLVPQVALRHALLNILGWMIPLARQAGLILTPIPLAQALVITVQIPGRVFPPGPPDPGMVVARQLIERAGGSLELYAGTSLAQLRLTIPALAQIPVLVIDDNADTIQLFQRYVQGSRYSIVGLQEPAEALRLVEKINPRIIVMDVMMPELDGWDLLTQLRQNRQLQNIAVIICSILPQEGLARLLGADGFLQKPILPQDFLNALEAASPPTPE